MDVQERYKPLVIGANVTVPLIGVGIGGFAAVTAGTITVVDSTGATILAAFPVAAGSVYGIPLFTGASGQAGSASFTTAGGASGTIFVQ